MRALHCLVCPGRPDKRGISSFGELIKPTNLYPEPQTCQKCCSRLPGPWMTMRRAVRPTHHISRWHRRCAALDTYRHRLPPLTNCKGTRRGWDLRKFAPLGDPQRYCLRRAAAIDAEETQDRKKDNDCLWFAGRGWAGSHARRKAHVGVDTRPVAAPGVGDSTALLFRKHGELYLFCVGAEDHHHNPHRFLQKPAKHGRHVSNETSEDKHKGQEREGNAPICVSRRSSCLCRYPTGTEMQRARPVTSPRPTSPAPQSCSAGCRALYRDEDTCERSNAIVRPLRHVASVASTTYPSRAA